MNGKNWREIIEQLVSMFYMIKKKNTYSAYVSKQNSNREKQIILQTIPNGER